MGEGEFVAGVLSDSLVLAASCDLTRGPGVAVEDVALTSTAGVGLLGLEQIQESVAGRKNPRASLHHRFSKLGRAHGSLLESTV